MSSLSVVTIIIVLIIVLWFLCSNSSESKKNCKCGDCGKCMCPEGQGEPDKCECSNEYGSREYLDQPYSDADKKTAYGTRKGDVPKMRSHEQHDFKVMRDRGVDTEGAGPTKNMSWNDWLAQAHIEPDVKRKHHEYATEALDRVQNPSRYSVLDDNTDGISTNFTGLAIPRHIKPSPCARQVPSTYNDGTGYSKIDDLSATARIAKHYGR